MKRQWVSDNTQCLERLNWNYPPPHQTPQRPEYPDPLPNGLEYAPVATKKPNSNDYQPVQDLREVNKWVEALPSTVHCTLLSAFPRKDCLYCVRSQGCLPQPITATASQPLFTFKWTDPEKDSRESWLGYDCPRGSKNPPTIFDEALCKDLGEYR